MRFLELAMRFGNLVAGVLLAALPLRAHADDWTVSVTHANPTFAYENWGGADATATSWSAYGGVSAALFGDIREDGLRIRASGGYGRYRYSRRVFDPVRRRMVNPDFHGQMTFNDYMLGYQQAYGAVIAKFFIGMSEQRHQLSASPDSPTPVDAENAVQGYRRGLKLALETWTSVGNWGFVQADGHWSQPFQSYGSRLRAGYRINPAWSAGLEASAFGNLNHGHGRAGAFLRFEWSQGEISASAGAGSDMNLEPTPYASINAMFRF